MPNFGHFGHVEKIGGAANRLEEPPKRPRQVDFGFPFDTSHEVHRFGTDYSKYFDLERSTFHFGTPKRS